MIAILLAEIAVVVPFLVGLVVVNDHPVVSFAVQMVILQTLVPN